MIEEGSDIIGVPERSWRSEERHNIRKGCSPIIVLPLPIITIKKIILLLLKVRCVSVVKNS